MVWFPEHFCMLVTYKDYFVITMMDANFDGMYVRFHIISWAILMTVIILGLGWFVGWGGVLLTFGGGGGEGGGGRAKDSLQILGIQR